MNSQTLETETETLESKARNPRILALAMHLHCDVEDLSVSRYDDTLIEYGNEEYLVLTDDEANQRWDESMDSYIDDCLVIPEWIAPYFDHAAWKRDAMHDGRGHSLSCYDGEENEEKINNEYYYIYRQN